MANTAGGVDHSCSHTFIIIHFPINWVTWWSCDPIQSVGYKAILYGISKIPFLLLLYNFVLLIFSRKKPSIFFKHLAFYLLKSESWSCRNLYSSIEINGKVKNVRAKRCRRLQYLQHCKASTTFGPPIWRDILLCKKKKILICFNPSSWIYIICAIIKHSVKWYNLITTTTFCL